MKNFFIYALYSRQTCQLHSMLAYFSKKLFTALVIFHLGLWPIVTARADVIDEVLDDLIAYEQLKEKRLTEKQVHLAVSEGVSDFSNFFIRLKNFGMDAVKKIERDGLREYVTTYYPTSGEASYHVRIVMLSGSRSANSVSRINKLATLFRKTPKKKVQTVNGLSSIFISRKKERAIITSLGEHKFLLVKTTRSASRKSLLAFVKMLPTEKL